MADGRFIPLIEQPPNATPFGQVLTRGESRTAWTQGDRLRLTLAEEHATLKACVAYLSDGTTFTLAVPGGFRRG